MLITSLASGSSGNCSLLESDGHILLVDCGLSAKRIAEAVKALGFSMSDVEGLLLTHEHSDHIKGLKRLMSAYGIPVYTSAGTAAGVASVLRDDYFSYAGKELMHPVKADVGLSLGPFTVVPFHTYHDAAEPMGFRFSTEEYSAAVVTDTGHYDEYITDHLIGLDALIVESNHDVDMLLTGPYPYVLKRRILSGTGHMSNETCGGLLNEIMNPRLKNVLLGHLSHENNTHRLALETVMKKLSESGNDAGIYVSVAPQDAMSRVIEL